MGIHLCEEIISSWRTDWGRIFFRSIKSQMVLRRPTGNDHALLSITRDFGGLSKWSDSGFETTTGKNFSMQSVIKSDGLLLYNTMELKRQMFLSRDYAKEGGIPVAIKDNNSLCSSCWKGACLLPAESRPRKDTLYLPCFNALSRHQFPATAENRTAD